jgi:hypothetical protein
MTEYIEVEQPLISDAEQSESQPEDAHEALSARLPSSKLINYTLYD